MQKTAAQEALIKFQEKIATSPGKAGTQIMEFLIERLGHNPAALRQLASSGDVIQSARPTIDELFKYYPRTVRRAHSGLVKGDEALKYYTPYGASLPKDIRLPASFAEHALNPASGYSKTEAAIALEDALRRKSQVRGMLDAGQPGYREEIRRILT